MGDAVGKTGSLARFTKDCECFAFTGGLVTVRLELSKLMLYMYVYDLQ